MAVFLSLFQYFQGSSMGLQIHWNWCFCSFSTCFLNMMFFFFTSCEFCSYIYMMLANPHLSNLRPVRKFAHLCYRVYCKHANKKLKKNIRCKFLMTSCNIPLHQNRAPALSHVDCWLASTLMRTLSVLSSIFVCCVCFCTTSLEKL